MVRMFFFGKAKHLHHRMMVTAWSQNVTANVMSHVRLEIILVLMSEVIPASPDVSEFGPPTEIHLTMKSDRKIPHLLLNGPLLLKSRPKFSDIKTGNTKGGVLRWWIR